MLLHIPGLLFPNLMTERKSTFSWQFSESTKGRLIRQIYEEVGRLGIRKQGKKRWPFLGGIRTAMLSIPERRGLTDWHPLGAGVTESLVASEDPTLS
ncbi:hypothetical protein P40_12225 [Alloalcanivorax xenomutans]|nr:hypothetical protein P40_12225 [Alloalcanivorax xenomutans]